MPMAKPDPITAALVEGAHRALARRAAALRKEAVDLTTTTDHAGQPVPIVPPEARVKASTADMLDEMAADLSHLPRA